MPASSLDLFSNAKCATLICPVSYDDPDGLAPLSQNEYLILAGTFHGVHAIASRISPTGKSSGVEVIEAESFKMTCLQSATGVWCSLTSSDFEGSDIYPYRRQVCGHQLAKLSGGRPSPTRRVRGLRRTAQRSLLCRGNANP